MPKPLISNNILRNIINRLVALEDSPPGGVTSVFGRSGSVLAVANDYDWSDIDKTVSSLGDLTNRSAGDLSSGTLLDARLSANVTLLGNSVTGSGSLVKNNSPALVTPTGIVKGDVGLGNVDNTTDAGKPVSTAQQTALDGKQNLDSDLTTIAGLTATTDNIIQSKSSAWASRTPAQFKVDLALVKGDVGLGSVDNTADSAKPVSTAQQTALDLKANLASPVFTGTPTIPSFTNAGHTHQSAAQGGTLDAAAIASGVLAMARLATGTPTGSKYIRDDGVLATPSGSGDMTKAVYDVAADGIIDTAAGGVPQGAWTGFTPTWTGLTVGTGGSAGNNGYYQQLGKLINFYIKTTLGTSGFSVGGMQVAYPVAPSTNIPNRMVFGHVLYYDSSSGAITSGKCYDGASSSLIDMLIDVASGTYGGFAGTSSTTPFTWAAGDMVIVSGSYEAA